MPIVQDTNFTSNNNPTDRLNKLLQAISSTQIEAHFVNAQNKSVVTRDYIEMVLTEYSQESNDVPSFNKWLQIDSTLDKALRKYKVEIQSMLQELAQMSVAKANIEEPVIDEAPMPKSFPQNPAAEKRLPTE